MTENRLLTDKELPDVVFIIPPIVPGWRDLISNSEKLMDYAHRISKAQDKKTRQATLREVGEALNKIYEEAGMSRDLIDAITKLLKGEMPYERKQYP